MSFRERFFRRNHKQKAFKAIKKESMAREKLESLKLARSARIEESRLKAELKAFRKLEKTEKHLKRQEQLERIAKRSGRIVGHTQRLISKLKRKQK